MGSGGPHRRGTRVSRVSLCAAIALLAGCSGLGGEGGSGPQFSWTIVNRSDEKIYLVTSQTDAEGSLLPVDPAVPSGNFGATINPGQTVTLGMGEVNWQEDDPWCFNGQHRWIVRSNADVTGYANRTPADDDADDLEVLTYVAGGTCITGDEAVWRYDS
jgi:hypothetical protein